MSKRPGRFFIWSILFSLLLTSCGDLGWLSADPGAEITCEEGVCVEITVSPPVALDQPTDILVRVSSTVDYPNPLTIYLQASPTNVLFGEHEPWAYQAVSGQSQVFHSTVTFTSEGEYLIAAIVWDKKRGGPSVVFNQDRVLVTAKGSVVNPTIDPHPTSDFVYPPRLK